MRRLQPVDQRFTTDQPERRPVERDVLDGGVRPRLVAQLEPLEAKRVGEPATKAGEANRAPGEGGDLAFDQRPPRSDVGEQQHHRDQQHRDRDDDGEQDEQDAKQAAHPR